MLVKIVDLKRGKMCDNYWPRDRAIWRVWEKTEPVEYSLRGPMQPKFMILNQRTPIGIYDPICTQLALTVPTTLRSQIGTVVYVRSHNFFISEAISTVLSVLERRDTVLSNAPKITEIG